MGRNNYHSKNRAKFSIKLHIVLVIKYRKSLLKSSLSVDIKTWCYEICEKNNVKIDEIESDNDHLHILIDIPPSLAPSKLVMLLKQQTTWKAWNNYENLLQEHFWKEKTLWGDGYFVCSTGDASTETIRKYIENQG